MTQWQDRKKQYGDGSDGAINCHVAAWFMFRRLIIVASLLTLTGCIPPPGQYSRPYGSYQGRSEELIVPGYVVPFPGESIYYYDGGYYIYRDHYAVPIPPPRDRHRHIIVVPRNRGLHYSPAPERYYREHHYRSWYRKDYKRYNKERDRGNHTVVPAQKSREKSKYNGNERRDYNSYPAAKESTGQIGGQSGQSGNDIWTHPAGGRSAPAPAPSPAESGGGSIWGGGNANSPP